MAAIHHDKRPPRTMTSGLAAATRLTLRPTIYRNTLRQLFFLNVQRRNPALQKWRYLFPTATPFFSPSCIALGCLKVAHWYPIIWASLFYFRRALPFTGRLSAVCPPTISILLLVLFFLFFAQIWPSCALLGVFLTFNLKNLEEWKKGQCN